MKEYLVLLVLSIASLSFGKPQPQQYGVPEGAIPSRPQFSQTFVSGGGGGGGYDGPSSSSSSSSNDDGGPRVFKHISIHVPPREEEFDDAPMKRVIRPMEKPDKIVNIIFVKAPSPSSSRVTEVILPSQPESRTVVYVLLRKASGGAHDVQIKAPKPRHPAKPEVFFIKYGKKKGTGGGGQGQGQGGGAGGSGGAGQQYGAPEVDSGSSSSSSSSEGSGEGGYQ